MEKTILLIMIAISILASVSILGAPMKNLTTQYITLLNEKENSGVVVTSTTFCGKD